MSYGLLAVVAIAAVVALVHFVFIRPRAKREEEAWQKKKGRLLPEQVQGEVDELLQDRGIRVDPDFHTGQAREGGEESGSETDVTAEAVARRLSSGNGNGQTPIGF